MGKEKEKKDKLKTSLKALLGIPSVLFFVMYFLFPVLAESFLKISIDTHKSRQEEFRANVNANKKRLDDIKREEEAEEMIKRELTFTSPQGTKTKEDQSPDVSDMLTPKIPEMDLDAMNEMRKKLEEFNKNR